MKNVLIGLVIYAGIFLLGSHYFGLTIGESLQYVGVPVSNRNFVDLVVITAASDCQKPYESIVIKNCLSDIPPFNYPRIWITLGRLVNLSLSYTTWLAIGIILVFVFLYLYVFKEVGTRYWPYVLALITSPVILLGIDRANSDIIIFSIVVIAAILLNKRKALLGTGLLLTACLLKLYPIFAVVALLKQKRNYYLLLCLGLFGIYCYLTLNDLILITKATPRGYSTSYGKYVFIDYINHYFPTITTYLAVNTWHIIANFAAIILPLVFFFYRRSFLSVPALSNQQTFSEILFLMGTGIYLGTFFIGNNWDYRLMFLHLTIPYLLFKNSINSSEKLINTIFIFVVTLVSWSNIGITNFLGQSWYRPIRFLCTVCEELGNWTIYVVLSVSIIDYLWIFTKKQPDSVQVL